MDPEIIISTITFILNSAVLSSFIIPQVQNLKEIKDSLFKYQIPFARTAGTLGEIRQAEVGQQQDAEKLQTILDTYRIRTEELQAVVSKFYYSVLVALLTILAIIFWPECRTEFLSIHPILQLSLLLWALKAITLDPDQVASPVYLVRHCEVNIHSFVQALGLSVYLNSGKGFDQRQDRNDPLEINLSMKVRVYGFRFLFFVADESRKVYFLSFGPITGETQLWRHILPPSLGRAEHDRIEIGKFKFNGFPTPKTFTLQMLIFLPIHSNEILSPMWGRGEQHMPGSSGHILSGTSSLLSMTDFSYVYRGIKFRGEGAKVWNLEIDDTGRSVDPIINALFKKYRNDFLRAKKIETLEDINGLIIDVPQTS